MPRPRLHPDAPDAPRRQVCLPLDMDRRLLDVAAAQGMTRSAFIRQAILDALEGQGEAGGRAPPGSAGG